MAKSNYEYYAISLHQYELLGRVLFSDTPYRTENHYWKATAI